MDVNLNNQIEEVLTLAEVLQEMREKPYVILREDIFGRPIFCIGRASTIKEEIEKAKEFARLYSSLDGIEPNIYRYRVYGPGSNEGIDV